MTAREALLARLDGAPEDVQRAAGGWPLCLLFDLDPGATVIVAGAYKGLGMDLLATLYPGLTLHGFEPQDWAAEEARDRLAGRGLVHSYGIGLATRPAVMGEWHTDAASFVHTGPDARQFELAPMREFGNAMHRESIAHIDLAVFNMEGYEFLLLPHLRQTGWLAKIDALAVQWHWGLGTDVTPHDIDLAIDELAGDGYALLHDDRPAWTYHRRVVHGR